MGYTRLWNIRVTRTPEKKSDLPSDVSRQCLVCGKYVQSQKYENFDNFFAFQRAEVIDNQFISEVIMSSKHTTNIVQLISFEPVINYINVATFAICHKSIASIFKGLNDSVQRFYQSCEVLLLRVDFKSHYVECFM